MSETGFGLTKKQDFFMQEQDQYDVLQDQDFCKMQFELNRIKAVLEAYKCE